MENPKGQSSIKNTMHNGKNSFLPPKSPFPSISPSYLEYIPSSVIGQKGVPKPKEGISHHQRTSSESFLVEEPPLWLDDLLNEPETPVRKGAHRRSSSDSFAAYMDSSNVSNFDFLTKDENNQRNLTPTHQGGSWGLQDFDYYKDPRNVRNASFYSDPNSSRKHKIREYQNPVSLAHTRVIPPPRERNMNQNPGSSYEMENVSSKVNEKHELIEGVTHEQNGFSERKEFSHAKSSASSETDTKRAKQQFAQRSRVRKLQYIAELERNVQALQAEGSDITAELEFHSQQNIILSMENKALNQRLENLAQEQLIKHLEHEVLERELGRLRVLYQQQQPNAGPIGLRRTTSRDLDQANVGPGPGPIGLRRTNSRDLDQNVGPGPIGLRRTSSRDLDQQLGNVGPGPIGLRRTNSRDLDQQMANLSANAGPINLRRTNSRDLDQQLAMLSLSRDPYPGQLHI